jgi:hypothetical protein
MRIAKYKEGLGVGKLPAACFFVKNYVIQLGTVSRGYLRNCPHVK